MDTRLMKLKQQREQVHLSLGEFLEEVSDWQEGEPPELTPALDRLLELTKALLAQIDHGRSEIDQIDKAIAEECVKNYIVKPGFLEDSGWGGISR